MTETGSRAPARNPLDSLAPTSESGTRMTELSPPMTPVTPVPTRHLPAPWVEAYARGELSPDLLDHAEAHLERCRPCVDAVDAAVRGGPHGPRLDALHAALVNRIG